MLKQYYLEGQIEAGCDEAGRGCLAGPVYAAAVILPPDYKNEILNDSKQLSAKTREQLRFEIEKNAIAWAVGFCTNEEIDKINILNASYLSMHRAIEKLKQKPEFLLIDGNRFRPYPEIKHKCIVKGDATYLSIAAASILAKTHRDQFMLNAHEEFPNYDWNKNMGYPTKKHRQAILEFGITKYHRKSYKLIDKQLKLF